MFSGVLGAVSEFCCLDSLSLASRRVSDSESSLVH
jgi:hypothetical protein